MRGSSRCVKTTRVLKRRGERPKKKDHVSIFGHWTLEGKNSKISRLCCHGKRFVWKKKGKSAFVNNLRTHAVVYTHTRTHKQKRSEENTQTHALAGAAENTKYARGKN